MKLSIFGMLVVSLWTQATLAQLPEPKQFYCQVREHITETSKNIDEFRKKEYFIPIKHPGTTYWDEKSELYPSYHYHLDASWNDKLDIMGVTMNDLASPFKASQDSFAELVTMKELAVVRVFDSSDDYANTYLRLLICAPDLVGDNKNVASHSVVRNQDLISRVSSLADKIQGK